jgi:CheY-like chemotaxis protein
MSVAQIHALVVDDNPRLVDSMKTRIGREIGWTVDWEDATDVDEGCRLIASSAAPFDLVIADLMFPREDFPDQYEPGGLNLIRDASQRSPHTFILAISIGSEHMPDLMDQARQLGAHHVVRRVDFSIASAVHSPAAIAAEIRTYLLDNGTVATCQVTADPHDPGIQGLLNQVGDATVARLYAKILEDSGGEHADRIDLRFLTPGASGASVCAVSAYIGGSRWASHILKLSQAKDLLVREAERGKRAATILPPNLLIQHRPQHAVGPVNGWYALGAPFMGRATTLRSWLLSSQPPAPAAVRDLLEELLVDGLGDVYAEGRAESAGALDSFAFTPYRQQCILQVLDGLTEALERGDGGGLGPNVEVLARDLKAFITGRLLPGGVSQHDVPHETYVCYQHGDLHAGNVLVAAGMHNRPLLIDTSHCGMAHWATDPAWLAVDLLMRSVDAGTESMLFTGFSRWRELAARFGAAEPDLRAQTTTPATTAALAALSWLATNLHRVTPAMQPSFAESKYRWEWHMALARSLLRSTYHSDIPHAKRALALVAAHDQLSAAAAAISS